MNEENTALAPQGNNPVAIVKNYLAKDFVKKRFSDMLDKRAEGFVASIVNVVSGSRQLQGCETGSIITSGLVAASLDLPIVPALGMAAIVPYGNKAQFQIMWRGVVQLCLRTGQYEDIQCTEIYSDELAGWNAILGEIQFTPTEQHKLRSSGSATDKDVVGYYARFKLTSGFVKADYMSVGEAMAHAKKYSKAYQYDLAKGKKTSAWSTDPVPMGRKTVLIRLLGRWGIKTIQLADVIKSDTDDFASAQATAAERIAAESGTEPIDTTFEENGTAPAGEGDAEEAKFLKDGDTPEEEADKTPEETGQPAGSEGEKTASGKWKCLNAKCPSKRKTFTEAAVGAGGAVLCKKCLGSNLKDLS